MKVHVLQHVPFEGIGSIQDWLASRGATISYSRFFEACVLPDPLDFELVIVMGGPMSVNDEETLPWLIEEKQFVRQAIDQGVAVLGICLGAQLIASVLGAKVYPGPQKEIGWFGIEAAPAGEGEDVFRFPESATVFHWHGETFDLPPGAIRLASSVVCRNQAFQWGARVIGLQFHLETTPKSAGAIISNCRDELVAGEFIQSEATLRSAPPERYTEINRLMQEVLSYLTRRAENGGG